MDRLLSLKIFTAVAREESFAAGARSLGLSAPAATRGVNELETQLGVRLFTRTTRQVRLTDIGQAYLQDVQEVLEGLRAADEAARGTAHSPVGLLRITCPQEFGHMHMAQIVADFLDRHEGIRVEMLLVDRIVNIVEEGYDIALRIGFLPASGLSAVRLGEVRRVVCGSPGYFDRHGRPTEPADLEAHRIVSVAPGSPGRRWRFGPGGERSVRVEPRLTVSSVAAAIDIARRGWGICQAMSYQIRPDLDAGLLETVLTGDEPHPLPVHLVHVEGRNAAAKVRAFVDFATERLREAAFLSQG